MLENKLKTQTMVKLFCSKGICIQLALIATFVNIRIVSGQDVKDQSSPIPENINLIFQTSCMPCHGSKGGTMPLMKVNFSKWTEYGAAKEEAKASLICKTLRKGKMPPKSVRKSNPELIPTKEQIDLICEWAESLKSEK